MFDARTVTDRLEHAGRTLMSLPSGGFRLPMEPAEIDALRDRIRPRPVTPHEITQMDEALAWLSLIPRDRYVLRRIVGARCMVCPVTGRHLWTWRRLASAVGADHLAVQRWHAQGVDLIVVALRRKHAA